MKLLLCYIINFMKYHIIVFGCQMNISDSERIASVLDSIKYKMTTNINEADLIVVTLCSVRQSAVDRAHGLKNQIAKLKNQNQNAKLKTILTGCVLKEDRKKLSEIFDYIIDIRDIKKLPALLDAEKSEGADGYLDITPKYSSKFSANVPIMTGCNNFCSYCVVPYTREREISRPAEEIISEIKNLVKSGHKEIWLLGQNVNSYKGTLKPFLCTHDRIHKGRVLITFPKLLKMVNDIPGKFQLNFLTSHPRDFSDELTKTMKKCKKLSKRLNLPIQSGDNEILKKMNRPYTVAQYKNLVKKIRKEIPDISLSTDVIVGFPGETKKQFENTVKTFKEIGFDMAFVNKYSPRPGTAAAKMKDNVLWVEKKRREKALIDLVNKKR